MIASIALSLLATVALDAATPSYKPTADELRQIHAKAAELASSLEGLAAKNVDDAILVDVEIYHKAAVWALRYADEEFYTRRYVADTMMVLDRGLVRAKELAAGRPSWPSRRGQLIRAYRSRVDGSVQPYGLAIPANYDGKPMRLDVVLHGRGATLSEVSFIASHDSAKPAPVELSCIRLDVYGRGNNAYRWAGETDVFEAIESVQKRYKIDLDRIVLRGFSMGGAGAWHLGLHHPGRWAAMEAGAGFTETKRYAKLDSLPACQEPTLHIYDAEDYALNAYDVPVVGYGGEDDAQLQASVNIREQLAAEGFRFARDGLNWSTADLSAIFLVGPKTGHKFHPASKQQSDLFLQAALAKKRSQPDHLRFVTYTTRYSECFWLKVMSLERHYQRAEVEARRSPDGMRLDITTRNIASLVLLDQPHRPKLTIDGREPRFEAQIHDTPSDLVLDKDSAGWHVRGAAPGSWEAPLPLRKTPGRQGPIDDAFAESFLCVRPTGAPHHRSANDYARRTLDTFAREFAKWLRGDVRVKDDVAVTPADIANHHLILFGDPGSNKLLGRLADKLPIRWNKDNILVGDKAFDAANHVLVMIYPNPLNPKRYVVLNSGHTFHEREFRGTNALLFPHLGDYAVLRLAATSGVTVDATPASTGWFGERWEVSNTASHASQTTQEGARSPSTWSTTAPRTSPAIDGSPSCSRSPMAIP
jgi:pimeloyl-ACP methyl ester carboxylesterase